MEPLLVNALSQYQYLKVELAVDFPDADEETLSDTVEGLTSLPDILASIIRSHLNDLTLVAALRARIAGMQERLRRLETRAEKKRELVISVMERADIKKLSQADFTASLRPTPRPLIIVDESVIPQPFWKPQPPKLDRKGLQTALGAGQSVQGATLGNGGNTLSVRTR